MDRHTAKSEVLSAALSLAASEIYDDNHPGNPNGDAECEWREEILNDAVARYVGVMAPKASYGPPAPPAYSIVEGVEHALGEGFVAIAGSQSEILAFAHRLDAKRIIDDLNFLADIKRRASRG